jgi:hypothetical protein
MPVRGLVAPFECTGCQVREDFARKGKRTRLVSDVGALINGATRAGKRVATYTLDGEVRFASAADRAAFAEELTDAVTGLISKYHDETVQGGRKFRIIVAVHPALDSRPATGTSDQEP